MHFAAYSSLPRKASAIRFLRCFPVFAVLGFPVGCAEPRPRPASHPASPAWPELPAQCHNPDDYVRCARIRRDQALAHSVPLETAASTALHDCSISCRYPYGPPAFPDRGLITCCDPESYTACVQRRQDELIAQGLLPASARRHAGLSCRWEANCRSAPRNPAERDASCADMTEDVPIYRLSLRQYYQSLERDASVEQ